MKPKRIQLSRKKGFNLQEESKRLNGLEAVNCARPGNWGNPYVVQFDPHSDYSPQTALEAVKLHRSRIDKGWMRLKIRRELVGKNLACWCKPGEPCHVDTLLEIANPPPPPKGDEV